MTSTHGTLCHHCTSNNFCEIAEDCTQIPYIAPPSHRKPCQSSPTNDTLTVTLKTTSTFTSLYYSVTMYRTGPSFLGVALGKSACALKVRGISASGSDMSKTVSTLMDSITAGQTVLMPKWSLRYNSINWFTNWIFVVFPECDTRYYLTVSKRQVRLSLSLSLSLKFCLPYNDYFQSAFYLWLI